MNAILQNELFQSLTRYPQRSILAREPGFLRTDNEYTRAVLELANHGIS